MILTGNANDTYAIPGQRYGVAAHSSTTVPAPPPECPCPCHLNEMPEGCSGVYCPECHRLICRALSADEVRIEFTHDDLLKAPRDSRQWVVPGPPDYWFITEGNSLDDALGEHFKDSKQAEARAAELNELDVIKDRKLSKKQVVRARRLHELAGTSWLTDDEFYWLRKEKRYAVAVWHDGWHDSGTYWETVGSLAEVKAAIQEEEVEAVVDLDTGERVPFTRTVTVDL